MQPSNETTSNRRKPIIIHGLTRELIRGPMLSALRAGRLDDGYLSVNNVEIPWSVGVTIEALWKRRDHRLECDNVRIDGIVTPSVIIANVASGQLEVHPK